MTEIYQAIEPFFTFINNLLFYKFFGKYSIAEIFLPIIIISLVIVLLGLLSGFIIDIGKSGDRIADTKGKIERRKNKK